MPAPTNPGRMPDDLPALLAAIDAARSELPPAYRDAGSPLSAADPHVVWAELRKFDRQDRVFLEWGSGIGTMTLLADRFGYRAAGIEIDPLLVRTARRIATERYSNARFVEGDYRPSVHGGASYRELGLTLDAVDIVYVFPWPDEIDACRDLFAAHARIGARLWVYSEVAGILESVRTESGCTPLMPA
ncbi:MAG: class I SAM-dependent methyltransferase [Phycisphaerae bacterium]|nr:class I SAM-dependent methyltransferase [Phycisphaerae bacterium]